MIAITIQLVLTPTAKAADPADLDPYLGRFRASTTGMIFIDSGQGRPMTSQAILYYDRRVPMLSLDLPTGPVGYRTRYHWDGQGVWRSRLDGSPERMAALDARFQIWWDAVFVDADLLSVELHEGHQSSWPVFSLDVPGAPLRDVGLVVSGPAKGDMMKLWVEDPADHVIYQFRPTHRNPYHALATYFDVPLRPEAYLKEPFFGVEAPPLPCIQSGAAEVAHSPMRRRSPGFAFRWRIPTDW